MPEYNFLNADYEKNRERKIRYELGCDFFRFNPDKQNFNIYRVIGDISNKMNEKKIKKLEMALKGKKSQIVELKAELKEPETNWENQISYLKKETHDYFDNKLKELEDEKDKRIAELKKHVEMLKEWNEEWKQKEMKWEQKQTKWENERENWKNERETLLEQNTLLLKQLSLQKK